MTFFKLKHRQPTFGIQRSPGKQHWVLCGRYAHSTRPAGQSLMSDDTASFDANIGSMTDFQSASVHDASALVATPLIRNVGVPEAPEYFKQMKNKSSF